MSSATATPEHAGGIDAPSTHVPQPIAPAGGIPVDGSAVTFSWTEARGALSYHLQVAADADFEQIVCTLEAGPTTLFTLLEMLPQDGSMFHWRVQAKTASGQQPWSPAQHFKARTDQHEIAFRSKQETAARQSTPARATAQPEAPDDAPQAPLYQTSHTSKSTMVFFMLTMLVTFAATFAYIAYVVTSAQ